MPELTPQQMKTLERLFAAGFRPIAIPPYESALCVRRGECAALLSAIPNAGLTLHSGLRSAAPRIHRAARKARFHREESQSAETPPRTAAPTFSFAAESIPAWTAKQCC